MGLYGWFKGHRGYWCYSEEGMLLEMTGVRFFYSTTYVKLI